MKLDTHSGIIRAELAKLILLATLCSLLLLMWGCSTPTEMSPVAPTITLKPYSQSSPTMTSTRAIPTITAQPTVGPTTTPFVHLVQKDDTLLSIAIRYGVTLEEILAANPGINPTILSIDQKVIIPGLKGESVLDSLPVSTPLPLPFSEVRCYPTVSKQLWCIATLENREGFPLEGVSAAISLVNEKGEVLESRLAFSPISLIPEGGVIPLAARFALPSAEEPFAIILPISAYKANNIKERYIPLESILETNEPGEDQKTWRVAGKLLLLGEGEKIAERVSILAVGLDEVGAIVGFRQLEFRSELRSGDELPFEMEIFSLGPFIDHVEIFAEALIFAGVE